MKTLVILLLAFLGIFNSVYAQDIVLSTNQTDYYFNTGEKAVIPIQINNTYGKPIPGNLQYTISQQINQGNMQLSNSNSEEKSLSIDKENSNIYLNLGKSDTASDYVVNINYNYNVNGDRVVSLGPISVHFVSRRSENTLGPQMHSFSQPNNHTPTRGHDLFSQQQQLMEQELNKMLGNPQDLFSQQQQQMEKELNSMTGNSQNQSQNTQQQLQNNQLSQDSNALKQQLEKQVQKQEQVKNEFERKLFSNNNFLSKHQKLLKNGYNISNSDLNPVTNDTGTFNIKYNNTNGKLATLQGNMKNGTVTHLNEQNQVEQERLLEKLRQNTQYQKFNDKLLKEGFAQNNATIESKANQTEIILKYSNQKDENAGIQAEFINDNLKQVSLNDVNSNQFNWILLLIVIVTIIGITCIYLVIKKIIHKDKTVDNASLVTLPKSTDYITESKRLMNDAVAHHNKGQFKEAFETAGKAFRFFLSEDAGIKKETTTQELIQSLQKNKYPLDDIIDCLKITDLAQFARYKPTESEFEKIVSLFNKLSDKIT
jgi:hypothetical protein